jgi:hypothetical protein
MRIRYPIFLVALALLLTEGALRVFDPLGASYLFEIHRYSRTVRSDPRFAYLNPPNMRDTFEGVEVSTNSEGLRGPEFASSKPPGVFRVVMLGDSVVFGWGVPYPQTFPARLQEVWTRAGVDAEVISAGACSWNTRTEYEFLKAKALAYQPDLLVLVIVDNDDEVKREGHTGIPRAALEVKSDRSGTRNAWEDARRFLLRHSHLAANVALVFEMLGGRERSRAEIERSPGWQDARLALDGIVELCRANGIELVVYLFPSPRGPGSGVLPLYEARLGALGVPASWLPAALVASNGLYRNSIADPHPNARGHALIAAAIEADLRARIALRSDPHLLPGAGPEAPAERGGQGENERELRVPRPHDAASHRDREEVGEG